MLDPILLSAGASSPTCCLPVSVILLLAPTGARQVRYTVEFPGLCSGNDSKTTSDQQTRFAYVEVLCFRTPTNIMCLTLVGSVAWEGLTGYRNSSTAETRNTADGLCSLHVMPYTHKLPYSASFLPQSSPCSRLWCGTSSNWQRICWYAELTASLFSY